MRNAWFFQANPDYYDVDKYLAQFDYIYWSCKVQRHIEEIHLGDDAYLWRARGASGGPRGILARCVVSELPKQDHYEFPKNLGDEFWVDPSKRATHHVGLRVLDSAPHQSVLVSEEMLKRDSELRDLLVITQRIGTSFRESRPTVVEALRCLWGITPRDDDFDSGTAGAEGATRMVTHKVRERDVSLVRRKKEQFRKLHSRLFCELCRFSFEDAYGALGQDFIEVHHIVPVAVSGERVTELNDLMCVCANCHRMLHRNGNIVENLESIRRAVLN